MEERPPSSPRVAWEESGAPQERRSPPEPYEVTEVQPLRADADSLSLSEEEEDEEIGEYEKAAMDKIAYILKITEKNEALKMVFLESVCTICRGDDNTGLCDRVALFCRENNLAEKVKELLEDEPVDQLCTAVRYQAMLAIAALSEVKAIAQEEILPLLNACFKAVFYLPPEEDLDIHLYSHTLRAMDSMLQMLLLSHCTSSNEELRNILEVLTRFTSTQNKTVQARALNRIWKLSYFVTRGFWQESFAKFVPPSQRTNIICMTLEAIGECSAEDREWASLMLDVVLRDPVSWMMDVPEILEFIWRNLGSNSTSLQPTLYTVLDVLTNQFPRDVLISVLTDLPHSDSTTLDIWKRMLSLAENSECILDVLCSVLQDQELCGIFNVTTAELGLLRLTLIHPTEENLQELCKPALLQRLLKIESLPLLWLVLRGLVLLSERPETAIGIRDLLPDVMETLRFANTSIALKASKISRNVMTHVGKREARPIVVELAEKLLPLFSHVSSEVREGSILLFKDVMEAAVWWQKRNMRKTVHRGLLPLLFQMSDETPSVAEASGEALVRCAKFLRWKELKRQAKRKGKMEIKECLLRQDRQTANEYLWLSLPYLQNSQASLRYEAVEFIALQPLRGDAHPAVRSVATGVIQKCQGQKAEPTRRRFKGLCCWPC
ncbi:uncharacterized protein LOC101750975 isoform X2 [Gallus gallus]|uniref:uncharacterized protein LOC101750371 isoform X2 n=1 Tax=Gallus gallus TaxID=9031 RepID=UPI001AEB08AC|nr:uncharacterized protein LOC101750371 isoform X2 [Gallus gallus]XP_040512071.1 uncharacterized protein LOC101750975 isoform X2 [Gallus gallus]XP_046793095.1 uncharacterized protein LOC101750371 isoform X2 [Gallus gallus]XP_046793097.1 uncharacterized protein LOC101750975 isoform X2 [Gallus gallus]